MKQQQAIALTALTGLLLAAVPAPILLAQAASASVRLSASRGQVELFNSGTGHWDRLRGSMTALEGTAVRTGPGAELQVTLADGSSMTLAEDSALGFARLRQNGPSGEIGVRLMGQVTANMSPVALANTVTSVDMPVARATFSRAYATAHAVRQEIAGAFAVVRLQTPTARAARMAVSEGAATMQPLFNIQGVVTAADAAHNTFTVLDSRTGRARRVVVGVTTLLATHDSTSAHAHRTPEQVVQALAVQSSVVVYGQPVASEGPGDADDARAVNATVIYPGDATFLSAEEWALAGGGPLVPIVGELGAITAGHTVLVEAGDVLPTILDGLQLVQVEHSLVGAGAGSAGSGLLIGGVLVATIIGVAIVNGNHGGTNNIPPPIFTQSTGTLNVTISNGSSSRIIKGRVLNRATISDPTVNPSFTPIGGPSVMAAASFHGSENGPSVSALSDGTVVGRLPLGRRWQLHLGATQGYSNMFYNSSTFDLGLDYSISANRALGLGIENRNYNVVDPLGNASTMSTYVPELRYSIRY